MIVGGPSLMMISTVEGIVSVHWTDLNNDVEAEQLCLLSA